MVFLLSCALLNLNIASAKYGVKIPAVITEIPTQLIARCSYSCATRVSELRHNKRRIPPIMTTFSCLFNAPGSLRSLRSLRPPRTTVARGASHVTHGVTESRKITGYSLSSCEDIMVKNRPSNCCCRLNISRNKPRRIKNKMKKYKKMGSRKRT
mgnify:CR=1 FL=1